MRKVKKKKSKLHKLKFSSNSLLVIIIIFLLILIFRIPEIATSLFINIFPKHSGPYGDDQIINLEKPAIYLYPTQQHQKISVTLNFKGTITSSYPALINNSWHVIANPDGTLVDLTDNSEYKYLFWEGVPDKKEFKPDKGFVIPGNNTVQFLKEKLPQLGLIPAEYNDFIVYWAPQMERNKYNLIYFAQSDYTENAKLNIIPPPQTLIRVFMVFTPLSEPINIHPQLLPTPKRNGFTVVEWGGAKL